MKEIKSNKALSLVDNRDKINLLLQIAVGGWEQKFYFCQSWAEVEKMEKLGYNRSYRIQKLLRKF